MSGFRSVYDPGDSVIAGKFPITTPDIATGAVTTGKIADDAVTQPKAATGVVDGDTVTGAVIQTAASGERVVIRNDGSGGIIESFSGLSGETASVFDPAAYGSRPTVTVGTGITGTHTASGALTLRSGVADSSELLINTHETIFGFGTRPGTEFFRVSYNLGSPKVDVGTATTPTNLNVYQDATIFRDVTIGRYGFGAGFDTWQVTQTSNANLSGTGNVTLSGLSQAVTSPGTGAVYMVNISAYLSATTGHTILLELLVDGTAQTMILVQSNPTSTDSKTWRITGLSAGSHTFTARARMNAAAQTGTVSGTHTAMTIERKA